MSQSSINLNHLTVNNSKMFSRTIINSKFTEKESSSRRSYYQCSLQIFPKNIILASTKIINSCLKVFYFSTSLKKTIIIFIPKPGKNNKLPENYRFIALLFSLRFMNISPYLICKKTYILKSDVNSSLSGESFKCRFKTTETWTPNNFTTNKTDPPTRQKILPNCFDIFRCRESFR